MPKTDIPTTPDEQRDFRTDEQVRLETGSGPTRAARTRGCTSPPAPNPRQGGSIIPEATHTHTTPTRRAVFRGAGLASIAAGLAAVPALARTKPHGADADIELLRLEPAFDAAEAEVSAAWAIVEDSKETEAITDAAMARMCVVLEAIELLQAQTLAGLKFKLRAVSWCTQGRLSAADLDDDPQPARDMRLLAGLLADLSAMGSAAA